MTHAELVRHAAVWLQRKHAVVITEMATGCGEEADAIGWSGYSSSTLVECKASRSDFAADAKKIFRQFPAMGIGQHRYFMAPEGLLRPEEMPERWGLLAVKDCGGVRVALKATPFEDYCRHLEIKILVSALRRTDGLCVKRYTYETKSRATIGCGLAPGGGEKG